MLCDMWCVEDNKHTICFQSIILYLCLFLTDKPVHNHEDEDRAPYKMIQTIGLSVGAAVAYIIVVLGLMFYCKKRRNAKRLQKGNDGEEPEMECLNGTCVCWRTLFKYMVCYQPGGFVNSSTSWIKHCWKIWMFAAILCPSRVLYDT